MVARPTLVIVLPCVHVDFLVSLVLNSRDFASC